MKFKEEKKLMQRFEVYIKHLPNIVKHWNSEFMQDLEEFYQTYRSSRKKEILGIILLTVSGILLLGSGLTMVGALTGLIPVKALMYGILTVLFYFAVVWSLRYSDEHGSWRLNKSSSIIQFTESLDYLSGQTAHDDIDPIVTVRRFEKDFPDTHVIELARTILERKETFLFSCRQAYPNPISVEFEAQRLNNAQDMFDKYWSRYKHLRPNAKQGPVFQSAQRVIEKSKLANIAS